MTAALLTIDALDVKVPVGLYGLAFTMTMFAAVAVQKNLRDAMQTRTIV